MTDLRRIIRSPQLARRSAIAAGLLAIALLCVSAELSPSTSAGYVAKITNSVNTAASAPYFTCSSAWSADSAGALFQYRLNETSGSVAVDSTSNINNGTYLGTRATSATTPIACPRDTPATAYVLNGTTSYVSTPVNFGLITPPVAPQTFTLEAWFKTTVASGSIIGYGSQQTGFSAISDRMLYLTTAGKLTFGVSNVLQYTLTTPTVVNDGAWHYVVATMSSGGMVLYLDGVSVGTLTNNAALAYNGYWRIGYDNVTGWPNTGANSFFTGSLRYVAAYTVALTATQVANHYLAGR